MFLGGIVTYSFSICMMLSLYVLYDLIIAFMVSILELDLVVVTSGFVKH